MASLLTTTDYIIFFAVLVTVMCVGLWVGRKEETSEDYFLADRSSRWWGVAGSIFGSNISSHQIIGMMGVGFSVGFAQSHFEISSIAGLLLLCYGFLPVYRRMKIYTLSEYLKNRYDERSRLAYAFIMILIIIVLQMVPGFYIGSRSMVSLLQSQAGPIDPAHYRIGILVMGIITGAYTIFGGLKAVIITDVIQTFLIIIGSLLIAFFTFQQPEIGGWAGMRALDAAAEAPRMHLYLPSNHPDLPWTGALTGLVLLHFYYWGTNQFVVQRTLAAKNDREARLGILVAGFIKLLIPFMSIGTGIAAFYLFQQRAIFIQQDTAFAELLKHVVAPIGFGIVGVIAAGMFGAILSSLDSWLNSSATLITFDFYKRYLKSDASEKHLVFVGRVLVFCLLILAMLLAMFTMDPNSTESFFLNIAKHSSKLIMGVVVAFLLGMFWPRGTAAGGFAAILGGIASSFLMPLFYHSLLAPIPAIRSVLGENLNFMHNALIAAIVATALHVIISLRTAPDSEKSKFTWVIMGGHDPEFLKHVLKSIMFSIAIFIICAVIMVQHILSPFWCAMISSLWVFFLFAKNVWKKQTNATGSRILRMIQDDLFWAGILAGVGVFMMFYFY